MEAFVRSFVKDHYYSLYLRMLLSTLLDDIIVVVVVIDTTCSFLRSNVKTMERSIESLTPW